MFLGKTRFDKLLAFVLLIVACSSTEQNSYFKYLGELEVSGDALLIKVDLYSEPSLSEMTAKLILENREVIKEEINQVVYEESSQECLSQRFYTSWPENDLIIIIDFIRLDHQGPVTVCTLEKLTSYTIKSTEVQAAEAVLKAVYLVKKHSKNFNRPSIIFMKDFARLLEGDNPGPDSNPATCKDFFFKNEQGTCLPCPYACPTCSNTDVCTTCFPGINPILSYWKTPANKCELCIFPECQTCETDKTCFECKPGFSLTQDKKCTKCQDPNCEECVDPSVCDKCAPGSFKEANGCKKCEIKGCSTCSAPNTCDKCVEMHYFDNVDCKKCGKDCVECTDQKTCTKCDKGFWKSENICKPCQDGCGECEALETCLECKEGLLKKDGKCLFCPKYCKECDEEKCLDCAPGFYQDLASGLCEPCSDFCITCSGKNNCLLCAHGVSVNGMCSGCPDHCAICSLSECLECERFFFLNITSKKCTPCPVGCEKCNAEGCLECQVGFFKDEAAKKCAVCRPGCFACTAANNCMHCKLGFFLDGESQECFNCQPNCAVCGDDKTCVQCNEGFNVNKDNKCTNCGKGCEFCEADKCKKCFPSFYYIAESESCRECVKGCVLCQGEDNCDMCGPGLYFNKDTKLCMECTRDCGQCRDDQTCDECKQGYFVDPNKKCSKCIMGCSQCKDDKTCFNCDLNFLKTQDNKCSQCLPLCDLCKTQDTCDKCARGYYKKENKCQACTVNCFECDEQQKCVQCNDSFFISDSGLCTKCAEGCLLCKTSNTCDLCLEGNYLDKASGLCKPCIPGCVQCLDSTSCDKCQDSFLLNIFTRPDKSQGVECKKCVVGCKECNLVECLNCDERFYKDIDTKMCVACSVNCERCSASKGDKGELSIKCNICDDGFYPNGANCSPCPGNCKKCDDKACQQCSDSYYSDPKTGKCASCQENCVLCANDKDCKLCKEGFNFDDKLKKCSGCKETCQVCDVNKVCSLCDKSFYPDGQGNCQKCPEFCQTCSASGCSSCNSGFFVNAEKKCQVCDINCGECESLDVCQVCLEGFYLSTSVDGLKATCEHCNFHSCLKCSETECLDCEPGFYLEDGACRRCVNDCDACKTASTCTDCSKGFYLNTGYSCSKCEPGCIECSVDYSSDVPVTVCSVCDKGFYLKDSICKRCNDKNCLSCPVEGKCETCVEFFYSSKNDGKCLNCKKNCVECKDDKNCNKCSLGYYLSDKDKACYSCKDGCAMCGDKGCYKCFNEYFLDPKTKSCTHCSPNCFECNSLDFCVKPYKGFYFDLESKTIKPCKEHCDECNNNECNKCEDGFLPNEEGLCAGCGKGCKECDSNGCTKCDLKYFINEDSACEACEEHCDSCKTGSNCNECSFGFYLDKTGDDACLPCGDNCLQCPDNKCTSCKTDFFLTSDQKCSSCPKICKGCEGENKCLDCIDNYYLDATDRTCKSCENILCVKCLDNKFCNKCITGYSVNKDGKCTTCPLNCESCDLNGICIECSFGFFGGTKGECLRCPEYCNGCKNFNFCNNCSDGYFQETSGNCKPCLRDCLKCSNSLDCSACGPGTFWDTDKCSKCAPGCGKCSNKDTCDGCGLGFYSENGLCVPCSNPFCSECTSTTCSTCLTGAFLNATTSQCAPCMNNCTTCTSTSDCTECGAGSYLNSSALAQQCSPCDPTCKTCKTPKVCDSCQLGFYMKEQGKCSKCRQNCNECDASKCFKCMPGFFINSGGNCEPCKDKCAKCEKKDICLGCFDGFYADSSGTCKACGNNCAVCNDPIFCKNCAKGYQLLPDNTCSGCGKGCATCDDNSVCTGCLNGFKLVNNKCANCSETSVVKVQISEDFKTLLIDFASDITNKQLDCNATIKTSGNLGTGWTCKSDRRTLVVVFGLNQVFDNQTLFSVYPAMIFINPCNIVPVEGLTSSFKKAPPVPKGKIKGLPVQTIGCGGGKLEYNIDEVTGSESMNIQVAWKATVLPENLAVSNYVQTLTGTRIAISTDLFEKIDSTMKLFATISNPMKQSTVVSLDIQLLANKQMTLELDKGTELIQYSSKSLEINVKVKDACGSEDKSEIKWTITNKDSRRLAEESTDLAPKSPKKLKIDPNFLLPGKVYIVTATATSGSVTGSASIQITTLADDLVSQINKQDGNISPLMNLVIDAGQSFDPNSKENQLEYTWSCLVPGTSNFCYGADSELLVSGQIGAVLDVPAERLVAGSELEIHVVVKSSIDERTSEKIVTLFVQEGLSTNIELSFGDDKVEPSNFFTIKSKITSDAECELKWTQVEGTEVVIGTDYTPNLIFLPNTLIPGETYEFQLKADESQNNIYASSNIKFTVNEPAECVSQLSTSLETGTALSEDFTLSIDSCIDSDETDTPLTYTFSIIPENSSPISITKPQSFNSVTFKLFEGGFTASVKVCDSLGGCSKYALQTLITVSENTGRRLADTDPIAFYDELVSDNEEATIMYAISIMNSFELTSDQVDYIYNDALDYIETDTIDLDSIDMVMKLIIQIVENQKSTLTFSRVEAYTELIIELVNNSTQDITSDTIDIAQYLVTMIIEYEASSIEYVVLVNDFLDQITEIYASGLLPGSTIINTATNNLIHFKYRDLSSAYAEKTFYLDDSISVAIESLPFASSDLIDINIKSFPDEENYSNMLEITFTKCGTLENNVLVETAEEIMELTTSTVMFELPALKNVTGTWACQYYDGSSWKTDGCELEDQYDGIIKVRISHTTLFRLYDSDEVSTSDDSSSSSRNYGPVIFISLLTLILISGYTVCYFLSKQEFKSDLSPVQDISIQQIKQGDDNLEVTEKDFKADNVNTAGNKSGLLSYNLMFGLFLREAWMNKADRLQALCIILSTQFAIEGALIGYNVIDSSWVSKIVVVAVISVVLTIPLNIVWNLNLRDNFKKGCTFVAILGFVVYALNFSLIVAMAARLTTRHTTWIITYFWGVLFEIVLEGSIMVSKYLLLKA